MDLAPNPVDALIVKLQVDVYVRPAYAGSKSNHYNTIAIKAFRRKGSAELPGWKEVRVKTNRPLEACVPWNRIAFGGEVRMMCGLVPSWT
jgi:hypothetical protein